MNTTKSSSGIATTALLVTFGATAVVFAQGSRTQPRQQPAQAKVRAQEESSGQSMQQVDSAYSQLHRATLRILNEETQSWGQSQSSSTPNDGGDQQSASQPKGTSGTSSSSVRPSLMDDEMLMVACSQGLLAGAPSRSDPGGMSSSGSSSSSDETSEAKEMSDSDGESSNRSQKMSTEDQRSGKTIGMMLVCEHSTGDSASAMTPRNEGGSQAREASARIPKGAMSGSSSRSSSSGQLKPGVYCVKAAGDSLWLTDRQDQVVLKTKMKSKSNSSDTERSESSGQMRDGRGEGGQSTRARDNGGNPSESQQPEWAPAFNAIAKEAMDKMSWSKGGSSSSSSSSR